MEEVHAKFSDKLWNEDAFEAGFMAAVVDGDGYIQK